MYQVLLVDDDMTNRLGIKNLLEWDYLGFEIVGSVENGKEALEFIKNNRVHLMITDMKMPHVDGIELMNEIRKYDNQMHIIAVSSYGDYELVRKAFKNNITDYLLKTDLSEQELKRLVLAVKEKLIKSGIKEFEIKEHYLKDVIFGNIKDKKNYFENYYLLVIDFGEMEMLEKRFQSNTEILETVQEIIQSIPRVAQLGECIKYSEKSLLLCYKTEELEENQIYALSRQIRQVVYNYLGIDAYIGVSGWSNGEEDIHRALQQASERLALKYIFGKERIFTTDIIKSFDLSEVRKNQETFRDVLHCLKAMENEELTGKIGKAFGGFINEDIEILREKCLELLYLEALMLEEIGDSFYEIWGNNIDYLEKLKRLEENSMVMMWMYNYNRGLMEYLLKKYNYAIEIAGREKDNDIQIVQHYIEDNYADSELSLSEIASIVNLNAKYLSVKFKKEIGMSFKEYLTKIRIDASKILIRDTNMKIEEISKAVGYNNMEHFIRVFKKINNMSPREYGKKN